MNKEFVALILMLGSAFNRNLTETDISVWWRFFKDEDIRLVKEGIDYIIQTEKFFPAIATLKKVICEIKEPTLALTGEEEWRVVVDLIKEYGLEGFPKAAKLMQPITKTVVKKIGWDKLNEYSYLPEIRKEFITLFDHEKTRKTEDMIQINHTPQIPQEKKELIEYIFGEI